MMSDLTVQTTTSNPIGSMDGGVEAPVTTTTINFFGTSVVQSGSTSYLQAVVINNSTVYGNNGQLPQSQSLQSYTFGQGELIQSIYVCTTNNGIFKGTNNLGCAGVYFQTSRGNVFNSLPFTPFEITPDYQWTQVSRADTGNPFQNLVLIGVGGRFGSAVDQLMFAGSQPPTHKHDA